jgi:hypothetical protein
MHEISGNRVDILIRTLETARNVFRMDSTDLFIMRLTIAMDIVILRSGRW